MPHYRFTVIIPTYNRQDYLVEAIDSVYAQTFSDWELLIVDDGSYPPARHLVHSVARDERLRYHYQQNMGLGAARQCGVELARGQYLCYLDDDDYFLPHHLLVLDRAIKANGECLALYKSGIVRIEDNASPQYSSLYDNHRPALPQHWTHADSMFPYAVPRSTAQVEPSKQYYFSEDFNWLGRLMLRLPVVQISAYTVVYRWHRTNRTRAILDREALTGRLTAVRSLYEVPGMAERVPRWLYHKMITHQCLHWVRQCLRAREYESALWAFGQGNIYFSRYTIREVVYTCLTLVRSILPGKVV